MHLLWIRHAQSVNNAGENDPAYQHQPDAPLSDLGHQQAQRLAAALRAAHQDETAQAQLAARPYLPLYRVDRLFCSPMKRALQTAAPVAAALGIPLAVLADAYEYGGAYQRLTAADGQQRFVGRTGLTRAEMAALVPGVQLPEAVTDAGWWSPDLGFESDDAYFERGRRMAALLREQAVGAWRGQWVAVVSHADFTNFLLKLLLMREVGEHPHAQGFIYPYNTAITRVDFNADGYPVLRFMGRVDHLPPDMVTF